MGHLSDSYNPPNVCGSLHRPTVDSTPALPLCLHPRPRMRPPPPGPFPLAAAGTDGSNHALAARQTMGWGGPECGIAARAPAAPPRPGRPCWQGLGLIRLTVPLNAALPAATRPRAASSLIRARVRARAGRGSCRRVSTAGVAGAMALRMLRCVLPQYQALAAALAGGNPVAGITSWKSIDFRTEFRDTMRADYSPRAMTRGLSTEAGRSWFWPARREGASLSVQRHVRVNSAQTRCRNAAAAVATKAAVTFRRSALSSRVQRREVHRERPCAPLKYESMCSVLPLAKDAGPQIRHDWRGVGSDDTAQLRARSRRSGEEMGQQAIEWVQSLAWAYIS
jgi:hypothetical protein